MTMRVSIVCALAGCGGLICDHNDDDTQARELAEEHARDVATIAGKSCLPNVSGLHSAIARVDRELVMCASRADHDTSLPLELPIACWTVDVAARTLAPRPPAILPGQAAIATVDRGVVAGFYVGPEWWSADLANSEAVVAPSTDGRHVAIATSLRHTEVVVVDTIRHTAIRITEPDLDNRLADFAYVGDRIYRAGTPESWGDSDPTLVIWHDDGSTFDEVPVRPIPRPPVRLDDGEIVELRGRVMSIAGRPTPLPDCP